MYKDGSHELESISSAAGWLYCQSGPARLELFKNRTVAMNAQRIACQVLHECWAF